MHGKYQDRASWGVPEGPPARAPATGAPPNSTNVRLTTLPLASISGQSVSMIRVTVTRAHTAAGPGRTRCTPGAHRPLGPQTAQPRCVSRAPRSTGSTPRDLGAVRAVARPGGAGLGARSGLGTWCQSPGPRPRSTWRTTPQPPTSSCARRTWPSSTRYPRPREPATDLLTPSQLSIDPACQVTSRRNEPLRIDGHNLKHSAHGGTTDLHNLIHR